MDRIATLAQRFFETGDDELESYVDAEAIFHSWPFLARGPAGVRQLRGMLAETFADHDVRIEDLIESGDRVVIRARSGDDTSVRSWASKHRASSSRSR